MNIRYRFYLVFIIALLSLQSTRAQSSLYRQFRNPPEEAKPWTFWYWMYGAVSKEGISADLEAMKNAGLGGAYLMPIKSSKEGPQYEGDADQLSPRWWEMIRHTMYVADSLDFKLGMHICDGFALAGGPWITPEESMQKVVCTDTIVDGGKITELIIKQPAGYQGYYKDIALYAYPLAGGSSTGQTKHPAPLITASAEVDTTGGYYRVKAGSIADPQSDGAWIQYEYAEPFTCRNIEIVKVNANYQAQRLKVMASDDGLHFRTVKQLVPARQGWQNTDCNDTHAIPPTTARYFRFYWNPAGSEPGSEDLDDAKWKPNLKIKALLLHSEPRLQNWEGKSGLIWRVARETTEAEVSREDCLSTAQKIDLTDFFKDNTLTAHLPEGKWLLIRIGHTSTGHTNATGGGGKGLECDKFSRPAVRKQFMEWFGTLFRNTDYVAVNHVLKIMHVDSWECGSQNWSDGFPAGFKARRGYDLMPYLPLLAGYPVDDVKTSERVLRDVRTTIAELVRDVFYDELAACAKKYDCRFSAECVAPTMVSDGMLHYSKVDLPMGEFWNNSPTHDKPNDMLDAISGGHIYGKNIIQAEGFTQLRGVWDEHPGMLKPLLDRNYALGMNKLVFHVYTHNPYADRRPGMTLDGIGLFFQRSQTWWKHGANAFVSYISRAQALLQYGHPVVDIAVFTGEEMPRRALLPERLTPFLPGIFGAKREYAYDSFNKDALLNLAKAENGRMVLPGGASYRVVVLPAARPMNPANVPLSPETQAKIEELRKGGVLMPELPYTAGNFSAYGLEPDVIVPEGIAWTHRSGEEAEIYFITNQKEKEISFDASLRYEGKPEIWDAVTGDVRTARYSNRACRTIISLSLAPFESVFIVFHKDGKSDAPLYNKVVKTKTLPLTVKKWKVTFRSLNDLVLNRKKLFDWSKETNEKVKYYSGTALYRTTFRWDGKQPEARIYLVLGRVANIANVCVNGIDCGTAWTAPYRVEITNALLPGENHLDIEVENTWANALNGADYGKAPFEGVWTNGRYRRQETGLVQAGLLGPVGLMVE